MSRAAPGREWTDSGEARDARRLKHRPEGKAEIWNAEDREHAQAAVKDFQNAYGAKYPKAVAKVTDDLLPQPAPYLGLPRAAEAPSNASRQLEDGRD
ncbi:hypothetical protein [Nonomuraea basaltis]|uniref:hypothetical protein n=1 Tax=Nonomuraea basaltis TaxID=2495887 RepID=UPI00110C594B|nr:hypothetical protein [Nonomuraea basaltis]TMR89990.1 hypothetical protein EJK15_57725 [Nonomuraea basaltis]